MTILEELKALLQNFLHWIYLLILLAVCFFSFGFSVEVFNKIKHDLLPADVTLIVTNPMSAFVSQILISLFLAFLISFPYLLYKLTKYLSPALHSHEKKLITKSLAPSVFLFFSGCIFAYYLLIPITFDILFPYAVALGAVPFFSVSEFISSVLGLMVGTGVMFLLPVFMVMASYVGLIKPAFWRAKWRHALVFFLIFSAVVTPDGTGVTMALLSIPLIGLYLLGCVLTARFDKSKMSIYWSD